MLSRHSPSPSPASGELWTARVLSGSAGLDDRYADVARGGDGSLYARGGTVNSDCGVLPGLLTVVKCDAAGASLWYRACAVPGAVSVEPVAIAVDPAGNAVAVATVWDGSDREIFVAKWNAAGAPSVDRRPKAAPTRP